MAEHRAVPYWHVDAFAGAVFGGNQAAVLELPLWPPDQVLAAIAAENNFAETAFLVRDDTGAADWELRWFTPTQEVALCGHATLASGFTMLRRDGGERVTFRTRKSGVLEVVAQRDGLALALPATSVQPGAVDGLLDALGCAGDVLVTPPQAQSAAIVLLENEAAVRALTPDMQVLGRIDAMAICTAPGDTEDVVSRVFVPAWGVDEDSVTGYAHSVLTPFWAERLGRDRFTAHQASQRGGDLTCCLDGNRVWLGGACALVVEGMFHLPDQLAG